jgi:hypothetical protein
MVIDKNNSRALKGSGIDRTIICQAFKGMAIDRISNSFKLP